MPKLKQHKTEQHDLNPGAQTSQELDEAVRHVHHHHHHMHHHCQHHPTRPKDHNSCSKHHDELGTRSHAQTESAANLPAHTTEEDETLMRPHSGAHPSTSHLHEKQHGNANLKDSKDLLQRQVLMNQKILMGIKTNKQVKVGRLASQQHISKYNGGPQIN